MSEAEGRTTTAPAHARVAVDGTSVVEEPSEASNLYSKGYYGVPQSGGRLALDTIETIYLSEVGRLATSDGERRKIDFRELLERAHTIEPAFEINYLVYRDLRQRGYVVRRGTGGVAFSVLPRGGTYPSTPSLYWIVALSERTPFSLPQLVDIMDKGRKARKKILIGVVDEESDLTYYLARIITPRGHHKGDDPKHAPEGVFLEDRVSVFEPSAVEELGGKEMFGSRVGDRLELSLLEALYLSDEERLTLVDGKTQKPLSKKRFLAIATEIEGDLALRLSVYRDLRHSGLIPKTGFKYGTHFRAYEGDPSSTHARYLLHVVPPDFETTWPELSRAIRLAQGVRKSFLLSWTTNEDLPAYLHLQRIRP
jgi:tRNA-intron endonuclease